MLLCEYVSLGVCWCVLVCICVNLLTLTLPDQTPGCQGQQLRGEKKCEKRKRRDYIMSTVIEAHIEGSQKASDAECLELFIVGNRK